MTSSGGPIAGIWARVNPFSADKDTLAFGKEGTESGYFNRVDCIALVNNRHNSLAEYSGGRGEDFDDCRNVYSNRSIQMMKRVIFTSFNPGKSKI